jgi:8-oxo-dGTP pyrophosphatase MutT (NUDIX family)
MMMLTILEQKIKSYLPAPLARGDHSLNPDIAPLTAARDAAVLVLLLENDGELSVVFTRRTSHMNNHAGQVSFPGGSVDLDDADATATALREAEEEIGLCRDDVRVIGQLDDYITRSGFRVRPVVGVVRGRPCWVPDTREVADVFDVPLSHILNGQLDEAVCEDNLRYYALRWQEYHIWGATAGMLRNLVEVLRAEGEI